MQVRATCDTAQITPWLASLSEVEDETRRSNEFKKGLTSSYMLNQRGQSRITWSKGNAMYTIIANPGVHWSSDHNRPWAYTELLLALGFPVHAAHGNMRGAKAGRPPHLCSSFQVLDGPVHEGRVGRKRTAMVSQAGNAMNFPTMGAHLLYLAIYTTSRLEDQFLLSTSGSVTSGSTIDYKDINSNDSLTPTGDNSRGIEEVD
jgi:hypothetical protein